MIRAHQVTAGYGERTVLDAISVEIAGATTGVVLGPGGSGKSTLLRVLAPHGDGVEPWWSGSVELGGTRPALLAQRPGEPRSLEELLAGAGATAQAVVARRWGSCPEAAARLAEVAGIPIPRLSPGLRRLAWLTVLLHGEPRCLLLDEPETGATDPELGWLTTELQSLRGSCTILLATHNLSLARAVADTAILLIDGVVIEAGPAPQFFEAPRSPRTAHFVRMGC